MNMLKPLWLILFFLAFCFFGIKAQAQTRLDALYQSAKKEGKVTVWSPLKEVGILSKEFQKEFPGVTVDYFEIREDDYISRVIAEARQGVVSFDMGTTRYATIPPLLDRGLLQSYSDWASVFPDLASSSVNYEGRFLAFTDHLFTPAYNTQLVKPEEAPRAWEDLLAPRWKGKILVEPRGMAFVYVGLKWGREKMLDYVKKIKSQGPRFVKGGTALIQQLAAGGGHVAVGGYLHRILQLKRGGAPIEWANHVSPIGAMVQDIFIMKGAPHPGAAKLFAGWLASSNAQKILNTSHFMGTLSPKSTFVVAQELEKNKVAVIKETLQNYRQAGDFTELAMMTLGAIK